MSKNRIIGLMLIILPIIFGLIAIATFLFATPFVSLMSDKTVSIINIFAGIFGFLGVLGPLLFIPLGIYFLVRRGRADKEREMVEFKASHPDLTDEQATFINRWSWGAFFDGFVWVLGNKLYLWALAYFVPFFNIYAWLKISFYGRRMAWEKGWKSFEQFKKRQLIMGIIIIILAVIGVLIRIFDNSDVKKTESADEQINRLLQQMNEPKSENPAPTVSPEVPVITGTENVDNDKDGLTDIEERSYGTNPMNSDTDGDLLFDREEVAIYGTNPINPDTDGDTYLDGAEVRSGYDPKGSGKLLVIPTQ